MADMDPSGKGIDEIIAGNRLLRMMPEDLRKPLFDHGEIRRYESASVLFQHGDTVDHTYFPIAPMMISMVIELDEKRRVEVATIGKEGALGGIVSCGDLPAYARAEAQIAGDVLRVPLKVIEEAKGRSTLVRDLFCRYADALLAQVMQSVACSAFHPIESRAARWLLTAQDRSGDELELTQGSLAALLGVQRTSINAVARQLQDEGLINYRRGMVRVTDRDRLEQRSCECYRLVTKHFDEMIGDQGATWLQECAE